MNMPDIILRPGTTNPGDVIQYDPTAPGTDYATAALINADSTVSASGGLTIAGTALLTNENSSLDAGGIVFGGLEVSKETGTNPNWLRRHVLSLQEEELKRIEEEELILL